MIITELITSFLIEIDRKTNLVCVPIYKIECLGIITFALLSKGKISIA